MSHRQFNEEPDTEKPAFSLDFPINKDDLSVLFIANNREQSNNKIKDLGLIPGVVSKLRTDVRSGLNSTDVQDFQMREEQYGRNLPVSAELKSIWQLISEPFQDPMLRVIAVCAVVDIILGICQGESADWIDGVSILFAVFLILLITAGNNWSQQKQFEKLFKEADIFNVQVIRDSQTTFIKNTEILVGDMLKFGIGDILCVDGLIVHGSEVRVDESNITGESKEVPKEPPTLYEVNNPFMISGSKVVDGEGVMVVCTVGKLTQLAKLREKVQEEPSPTPLQLKLEGLSSSIANIALTAAALTYAALMIHFGYELYVGTYFVIAVTVIVVAVPEGLPLAVTLSLAYSVNRMRQENNWVRFLSACETMGGVDNICTDKTGTLTTNSMKVESLFFEEKLHDKAAVDVARFPNKRALDTLCESICINSNIQRKPLPNGQTELVGSKTEAALIMFSEDQGMAFEKVRDGDRVVRTIAFSSKRKKMITVFKTGAGSWRVHVKGASEVILNKSTSLYSKTGDRIILDKYKKDQIMKDTIEVFAADALRTISIAYKDIVGEDPSNAPEEILEKDLTLLAIFGIRDPLRKEIPKAIETCKTAGITVRMVTGDNSQTAVSIAKKAGILPETYVLNEDSYVVMEGSKFTKEIGGLEEVDDPEKPGSKIKKVVNDIKFKEIIKELRVMSRSSPDDKYNLVTGLKESDHVVAVTGDGTNDAPALKKANIGFAMDSGSAVAKEAAGIILLDDNFNSIVLACKWGRNIFDSIRKFVQFQMTINVVALVLTFLGSAVLSTSPLSAVQMLWINLIMDTFAALALATEPPTDDLLERRPYGLREDIISPGMKRFIFGHTLYQLTVLMIILFEGPTIFKIPDTSTCSAYDAVCYQHFTIFFHTFVMMQVFNSINSRKLNKKDLNVFKNFCNNPLFFIIISCIFVAQIFIVEVGSSFTETSPLSITQHLICILLGSGSLLVGWLFKLIPEEVFSKIKFFKDTEVNAKTMERVTTKLRRGASSRISSKSYSQMVN